MNNLVLYLYFGETEIDRPLSRILRDRAAALSFGEGAFSYAETKSTEKPRFLLPEGAFFNVTHTENLFLCAVSNVEMGLDAEGFPSSLGRREKIAERIFSDEERAYLKTLETDEYLREFTLLWTRHEASAKISGRGLSQMLSCECADLIYTDLTPLLASLGISAAATLCTAQPVTITLAYLED